MALCVSACLLWGSTGHSSLDEAGRVHMLGLEIQVCCLWPGSCR